VYVGRDNSGVQTIYNGPVLTIHPAENSALAEAQFAELRDIENFIGKKDERALRTVFDLPDMLNFNIRFAKNQIDASKTSQSECDEMNAFFMDGNAKISANYGKLSRPHGGAVLYEKIPGEIAMINVSKKHMDAFKKLQEMASSSLLPSDVITALQSLAKTIEDNCELMFEVFNERYSVNHNNLFKDDDPESTRHGAISSPYWEKFSPLKPKTEAISAAIKKHLGVR
jgi:hypothetical protein